MIHKKSGISVLGILVIIMVAGNLRAPITAVGPILSEIKTVLSLNTSEASLLTSIPLAVFAFCSIMISRIAGKGNIRHSLIYTCVALVLGLAMRVYGNVTMLYIGSIVMGLGICIGNVTTPAYIKQAFPNHIGLMTGIFSVSMNLIAAMASGLSLSIGQWTGLGWKGSLGVWTFWSVLALLVVLLDSFMASPVQRATRTKRVDSIRIFRSNQAWNISFFMGGQSLVYYCLVALLPVVLVDYGMPKEETGMVLFTIQMAMLPVMFIAPVIASKMKDQKVLIYAVGILMFSGVGMLILCKRTFIYTTAILMGGASGLAFSLAILFFSLKSKTMEGTIKISGMAQSVGYLIAAIGPPIFGLLYERDPSWQSSFYFLLVTITLMVYFGAKAARQRFIED
ncbi:MFS transporter [Sphingobacterium psychroaquaticum]|uniref:MFS transporter n=1 Tax=Sphingobacterium psychroaquaticum TaxID=561061 RepID=UPI00106AB12A|nr:MFS transporter [Sphingobacterium psychroaquaticum]QBQ40936.1 MFS transporter [Sphingobacterium psychroaquaticum]